MNKPINIGVVGLGRLGRLYARYFTNRLPGARLYGVTDVAPEAVKATVAETGAKGFATTADLLAWNTATDIDKDESADVASSWQQEKNLY